MLSILFWILVWHLIARKVNLSFVLPTPSEVFLRLWELLQTFSFYRTITLSFLRVAAGFGAGLIGGFFLAMLSHKIPVLRTLFEPLIAAVRAAPVASFILVVILWLERGIVPAFISFLMVLPIVWQNTLLGLDTIDADLLEMARVFRIGAVKRCWKMEFKLILPDVLAAAKTSLGLAWKAGVAAEVLALPKVSVGMMIYNAKQYLETADLYAWTIAIVIFSVLLEKLFLKRKSKGEKGGAHALSA